MRVRARDSTCITAPLAAASNVNALGVGAGPPLALVAGAVMPTSSAMAAATLATCKVIQGMAQHVEGILSEVRACGHAETHIALGVH